MCWFYGSPGIGKAPLAHTMYENLHNRRHLAGVFFCRRDDQNHNEHSNITLSSHSSHNMATHKKSSADPRAFAQSQFDLVARKWHLSAPWPEEPLFDRVAGERSIHLRQDCCSWHQELPELHLVKKVVRESRLSSIYTAIERRRGTGGIHVRHLHCRFPISSSTANVRIESIYEMRT